MSHRVFVYGTLLRGCTNHFYLAGQTFIKEATTLPRYRMYDLGGFPGMVEVSDEGLSIRGEVWDVDAACLAHLDVLEGIAVGEYARVMIPLLPHDDQVEGYVWLRSVTGYPEVGTSWREYLAKRQAAT